MTERRSWSTLKRGRKVSVARRAGYRRAKEAFEIAERVRHARERLDMTQAQLAARIGSTQPAVARLEAGGVTPNLDTLHRIAEALGLELIVDLRRARCSA
ncbi:MAG: helix-turn-helix transcriptional regulator [Deltaproteobacteria bacterium]|nr:helix-turn-helix transcriptional regulator [Deltaproteobacteria bacterium]